jgi:hypothetical protein
VRLGGVLTLVLLGAFFVLARRRDIYPPTEGHA